MAAAGVGEGNSVSVSYTGDPTQWNTVQDEMVATNDDTTESIQTAWDETASSVSDDIDEISTAAEGLDSTYVIDVSLDDATPDGDVKTDIEAIDTAKTNLQADPTIALTATLDDASGDGTVADTLDSIDAKMIDLADKKAALEVSLEQGDPDGTVQKAIDTIDSKMDDLAKKKAELEVSLNDTSKDGDVQTEIDDIDEKMDDLAKKKAELEVSLTESTSMTEFDSINAALDDLVAKMKDLSDKKAALTVTLNNTTDEGDSVSQSLDADARALADLQTDAKDPVEIEVNASDNGTIGKEEADIQSLRDDAAAPVIVDVQGKGTGLTTDDTETTTLDVVDDPDAERVITEFKGELDTVPDEETTELNAVENPDVEIVVESVTKQVEGVDDVHGDAHVGAVEDASVEESIVAVGDQVDAVDEDHADAHLGATYDPVAVAATIEALKLQIKEGTAGEDMNVTLNWEGVTGGGKSTKADKGIEQGIATNFVNDFLTGSGLSDLGSMISGALKTSPELLGGAGVIGGLTGVLGSLGNALPGLGGALLALQGQSNALKSNFMTNLDAIITSFSQAVATSLGGPEGDKLKNKNGKSITHVQTLVGGKTKTIPGGADTGALGSILTTVTTMLNDLVVPTKDFATGMTLWSGALNKVISSKGFQSLLSTVSGMAIGQSTQWGTIVGEFLTGIGQMLVAMAPLENEVITIFASMAASFSGKGAKTAETAFFGDLTNFLKKDGPDIKTMFDSLGTFATSLINVLTAAGPGLAMMTTATAGILTSILNAIAGLLNTLDSMGDVGKGVAGVAALALLTKKMGLITAVISGIGTLVGKLNTATGTVPKTGKGINDPSTSETTPEQQKFLDTLTKLDSSLTQTQEKITDAADKMDKAAGTQTTDATEEEAAGTEEDVAGGEEITAGAEMDASAGGSALSLVKNLIAGTGITSLAGGATAAGAITLALAPFAVALGLIASGGTNPHGTGTGKGNKGVENQLLADLSEGIKLPNNWNSSLNAWQDKQVTAFQTDKAGTTIKSGSGQTFVKENNVADARSATTIADELTGAKSFSTTQLNAAFQELGKNATQALITQIQNDNPKNAATIKKQFDNLLTGGPYASWKVGSPPKVFTDLGTDAMTALTTGMTTESTTSKTKMTTLFDSLITLADTYTPKFNKVGGDWSTALATGITADQAQVVTAATNLANAAVAAVQNVFAKAATTVTVQNSVSVPISTATGVIPPAVVSQVQSVVVNTLNEVAAANAAQLRSL